MGIEITRNIPEQYCRESKTGTKFLKEQWGIGTVQQITAVRSTQVADAMSDGMFFYRENSGLVLPAILIFCKRKLDFYVKKT